MLQLESHFRAQHDKYATYWTIWDNCIAVKKYRITVLTGTVSYLQWEVVPKLWLPF